MSWLLCFYSVVVCVLCLLLTVGLQYMIVAFPGLVVIKLEFSLRLKIKCNDWLLVENELKFYNLEAWPY